MGERWKGGGEKKSIYLDQVDKASNEIFKEEPTLAENIYDLYYNQRKSYPDIIGQLSVLFNAVDPIVEKYRGPNIEKQKFLQSVTASLYKLFVKENNKDDFTKEEAEELRKRKSGIYSADAHRIKRVNDPEGYKGWVRRGVRGRQKNNPSAISWEEGGEHLTYLLELCEKYSKLDKQRPIDRVPVKEAFKERYPTATDQSMENAITRFGVPHVHDKQKKK